MASDSWSLARCSEVYGRGPEQTTYHSPMLEFLGVGAVRSGPGLDDWTASEPQQPREIER
jgi:hypothetical protein